MRIDQRETSSDVLQDDRDDLPMQIHSELDDFPLSAEAFRVYAHLVRRAGKCRQAWPSYKSIGERCFRASYPNASASTLRIKAIAAVQELAVHRLIVVEHQKTAAGDATSNVYHLTSRREWIKERSADFESANIRRGGRTGIGGRPKKNRLTPDLDQGSYSEKPQVVTGSNHPSYSEKPQVVTSSNHPSYSEELPPCEQKAYTERVSVVFLPPEVNPIEVNPTEVNSTLTPQGEESAREEEILLGQEEKKAKPKAQTKTKTEKKPRSIPIPQTINATESLHGGESRKRKRISSGGATRSPFSHRSKGQAVDRPLPPWRCSWSESDYDLRFLDYLRFRYLPKVGRWRDLGEKPTLGDAKNWLDAREKRGDSSQIQNKWDDYQALSSTARTPTPYSPPATALREELSEPTPEEQQAKAQAIAAAKQKFAALQGASRRRYGFS